MLTCTPADSKRLVHPDEVNCTPWSVSKISGHPFASDSSRIARQNALSRLFDNRQLTTTRLCQSIAAAKYTNPVLIGTYGISALQTRIGRSIVTPLSQYEYFL